MCYNKFTVNDLLARETLLMRKLQCETEVPHFLDFLLYYFKLIKVYIELSGPFSNNGLSYINVAERLSRYFCKMALADIVLISVKPSIIAAAATLFGLQKSELYFKRQREKDIRKGVSE